MCIFVEAVPERQIITENTRADANVVLLVDRPRKSKGWEVPGYKDIEPNIALGSTLTIYGKMKKGSWCHHTSNFSTCKMKISRYFRNDLSSGGKGN